MLLCGLGAWVDCGAVYSERKQFVEKMVSGEGGLSYPIPRPKAGNKGKECCWQTAPLQRLGKDSLLQAI